MSIAMRILVYLLKVMVKDVKVFLDTLLESIRNPDK